MIPKHAFCSLINQIAKIAQVWVHTLNDFLLNSLCEASNFIPDHNLLFCIRKSLRQPGQGLCILSFPSSQFFLDLRRECEQLNVFFDRWNADTRLVANRVSFPKFFKERA